MLLKNDFRSQSEEESFVTYGLIAINVIVGNAAPSSQPAARAAPR
jgi:hypothetical protein